MRVLFCLAIALGWLLAGQAGRAAERVDYLREIKPILAARCYACHGALQQKSGLRVDTAKLLRDGGNEGPAIVPGRSADSNVILHVTASNGARRMPPSSEGEGLTAKQVALLRAWIDQGAVGPADEKPEADPKNHWAFRPPLRPAVPTVKEVSRVRNPIDAFIAAQWEKHGLSPQPPADKGILLRRVYLDLIGLPPSREELAAFVADQSPDAFEKVVDRLLASKQYGERWGRHWMDIWRYSDWWGLGAEVRNSQKHIWHWRDWIIESLNADKGYDQMLREMLAADELYPNDLDRLRATGFLARSYFIFNRNTWLEETLEHTSKAFLGLTVNCAKCHDHKFDPIRQTDFYSLRAFFEPYQVRIDEIPGEIDFEKDGIPRVFDCNLTAPTYRFVRGDERQPVKDKPLAPGLPPRLAFEPLEIRPVPLPAEAHAPGLRPFVLEDHLRVAEHQIRTAREALEAARKTLVEAEKHGAAAEPVATAPGSSAKSGVAGRLIFRDDFAGPKPELWEVGAGQWKHESGKLLQQLEGETRSVLRAKPQPPPDFQARFRFAITGGEPWRSVGLCFDAAGDNEVLVYASAYQGGPKVQITYKQGGQYVYPPEAMQARPIKLNEPLELSVRVRGPLLNVAVNGEHALAYRLPLPRKAGRIQLITYAARAEFIAVDLTSLPDGVKLVEANAPAGPPRPPTVAQARAAVVLVEKALATAAAQPASLRARVAADKARYQQPPAADAGSLARQAALAERRAAVARAEEDLARAELEVLQAEPAKKPEAEKKRATAVDALAKARKAAEAPGETYTPLRGALKTLESNLETGESRSKPFPATSTGRRSALAQWLTDPRHPLTARVAVNHIWARHFGKPLVATVFDFGRKGAAPTHPALLDYLAVELMDKNWSIKHLHRLIVTSNAYRLTSSGAGAAPANRTADADNRYYWHMNSTRMEAQAVRDSLLYLAGELDTAMGGPSIDPAREELSRRRSLYFVHSHNDHHKFLSTFDDASVLECYRRTESIVPQQALALSNSKFALTMAAKINAHLHDRLGNVPDAVFVRAAFEMILAGAPTAAEQRECEQALAQLTELLKQQQQPDAVRRARGDLIQALLNHNDFITIR
jgi:hypothetical protein